MVAEALYDRYEDRRDRLESLADPLKQESGFPYYGLRNRYLAHQVRKERWEEQLGKKDDDLAAQKERDGKLHPFREAALAVQESIIYNVATRYENHLLATYGRRRRVMRWLGKGK